MSRRGGFGFLGGPGETQIEADRRQIRDRMARIRRGSSTRCGTRAGCTAAGANAPWPVIALVGYTNAGKSTLFNRMTQAAVVAEDLLFATLDPTMRNVKIPGFDRAILSDTVGSVSNLPTELVARFRATLEEVAASDLILHVRDIAHPDSEAQAADVEAVLSSLGWPKRVLLRGWKCGTSLIYAPRGTRGAAGRSCPAQRCCRPFGVDWKGSESFARRFPTCYTPALRPTLFRSMPAMENGSPGSMHAAR